MKLDIYSADQGYFCAYCKVDLTEEDYEKEKCPHCKGGTVCKRIPADQIPVHRRKD